MRNIGLVLSGGMAKGAYQIGALRAINELFEPSDIKYVSSASVGALNSYIYLTHSLDKGEKLWHSVNNDGSRAWITSLLRSSFLQNAIKEVISEEKIPNVFYVPLFNLKNRILSYVDFGKIPQKYLERYFRASVAMPIYNPGVRIKKEYYYDGAIIDNIPIYPILKHSLDFVICIHFDSYNYTFENEKLNNKIIKMSFSDNKIISSSLLFKKESIEHMISEGYAKAKRILEYVFINGTYDLKAIYARVADLNAMDKNNSFRITGDIVVKNMNKVTQKLIRRMEIVE